MAPSYQPVVGVAWYRKQDFDRLMTMFVDAADLPDTYGEWLKTAQATVDALTFAGVIVVKAHIDPVTFPQWCLLKGLRLDAKARLKFATEMAEKECAK